MKKNLILWLIVIIAVLGVLVAVLNSKKNPEVNPNNENISTSVDNENVEDNWISTVNCEKAVEDYLAWVDKEWEWEWIKAWDNIVVDYVWRLEDGSVFDTSIESIAKACWKYNEGRDYAEWLAFEAWAWQMVKWFDNWVIWMKLGQTKTVKFGPEEWYWLYDSNKVETYSAAEVWDLSQYELWLYICKDWYTCGTVTKLTDKEMVVDFNGEFAGKDLIFDITVKSIN